MMTSMCELKQLTHFLAKSKHTDLTYQKLEHKLNSIDLKISHLERQLFFFLSPVSSLLEKQSTE